MSKIICDVCGTSYPETATQCPICGCVRSVDAISFAGDTNEPEEQNTGTYTYVKGGRFSKSNVGKRNRGEAVQPREAGSNEISDAPASGKKDTGLVIAILALLLAIIGVVIFIAMRYFAPEASTGDTGNTGVSTSESTAASTQPSTSEVTEDTSEPTVLRIPCTDIVISKTVVEFDHAGASVLLNLTLSPVDTNDEVIFTSSDEAVATVSESGKVTAVAGGEAIITVSCGDALAECRVVCNIENDTTESTQESTEPVDTEYDPSLLKLDWRFTMLDDPEVGDATLARGTTWQAYTEGSGKIPADKIKFSSTNTAVATIDETGLVTAVGSGQAYIKAEYGGVTVECRILCP